MSKRIWNPPVEPQEGDLATAWRSLGEKENSQKFRSLLDREFPEGDELNADEQELSRRDFSKFMGASAALAGLGLASCRRPESYIVPYKNAPEWIIPGKPLFYASSRPRSGGAVPLVVTTHEGRPTKIEPNIEHPDSRGTDALTQASILDLYSPNRSQKVLKGCEEATWSELKEALQGLDLSKTGLVFGEDDSPTRNRLAKELAGKGAQLFAYEALTGDSLVAGQTEIVDFRKADRILSLDCDFLGVDEVGNPREFGEKRQGGNVDYDQAGDIDSSKMNRLYQVEAQFSLTGGVADHRLRVAPSRVAMVAAAIATELGVKVSVEKTYAGDKEALFPGAENPKAEFDNWIKACAADLKQAGSKALVLAGSRQTKEVKQIAAALNQALSSAATDTVQTELGQYNGISDLAKALEGGAVKNIIFFTPSNPVYDSIGFAEVLEKAETSIHWGLRTDATAWACDWHIPAAHYLESWGDTRTATGAVSFLQPMILPLYGGASELDVLHVLGGGDFAKGEESPAMAEVRKTFTGLGGQSDDAAWLGALQLGFIDGSTYQSAPAQATDAISVKLPASPSPEALEIIFATDSSVLDGRFIDNAWMQEAPDPVTKQTWDNAAWVSPQTAKDLGIYDKIVALEPKTPLMGFGSKVKVSKRYETDEGEGNTSPMIAISVNGQELHVPVLIAYGHADNAITIPLGYGQAANDGRQGAVAFNDSCPVVGHVGLNTGFNAYPLRTAEAQFFATGAKTKNLGKRYKIALTQEHNSMYGRALAREISTADLPGKGNFAQQKEKVAKQGMDAHAPPNISLYKPEGSKLWSSDSLAEKTHLSDEVHQWGMAIDLNTCTGCNACLVSCQAENNIPVVGKRQVAMGREMHWIRMDRYFSSMETEIDHGHYVKDEKGNKVSTPSWVQQNPESIPQPVACVQCEMAPCETVCPVNATVHTEEGLNSMAYNRCIGTRYCANNCPYKARRFNFFDYNKRNPLIDGNLYKGPFGEKQEGQAPHLQKNPNVTVRMRGVMEKCTYCVQRLESAKIRQKQMPKQKAQSLGKKSTEVAVSRHEDLRVPTDSVKTACQDACPTGAISFGNLLNEESKVVRAKGNDLESVKVIKQHVTGEVYEPKEGSPRNYDLLNYINTRPRTSYLARVKNPNSKMPDAKYLGQATINLH